LMMRILPAISIIIFFFFLQTPAMIRAGNADDYLSGEDGLHTQDSLKFEHHRKDKEFIIIPGTRLKVWHRSGDTWLGSLDGQDGQMLFLITEEGRVEIPLEDIRKLKLFRSLFRRVSGEVLVIAGVGGMLFGGLSLAAGIGGLISGGFGAIILVAVPVLVPGGYGLYVLGRNVDGKRIVPGRKWVFQK